MEESLDITQLYDTEANLVQEKISHILTIRSLAITVLAAVLGLALVYPGKGLEFLSLVLVPLYALESIYDVYLIPFVERETLLRKEIAGIIERRIGSESLSQVYRRSVDHRLTPASWRPFQRAFLDPLRVAIYLVFVLGPLLVLR